MYDDFAPDKNWISYNFNVINQILDQEQTFWTKIQNEYLSFIFWICINFKSTHLDEIKSFAIKVFITI